MSGAFLLCRAATKEPQGATPRTGPLCICRLARHARRVTWFYVSVFAATFEGMDTGCGVGQIAFDWSVWSVGSAVPARVHILQQLVDVDGTIHSKFAHGRLGSDCPSCTLRAADGRTAYTRSAHSRRAPDPRAPTPEPCGGQSAMRGTRRTKNRGE